MNGVFCKIQAFRVFLFIQQQKIANVNIRCLRQRAFSRIISVTNKERTVFTMLNENIKAIRKSKGLSQEELAVKLNVVRQTVSKWEQGLSVPDSDMLISISEALETPVSILLGETVVEEKADELKAISEKLEIINLQLAKRNETRRKILNCLFISLFAATVMIFAVLTVLNSPYLNLDYNDPENAVFGAAFHVFEWLFVRSAPILLIVSIIGFFLSRKKG